MALRTGQRSDESVGEKTVVSYKVLKMLTWLFVVSLSLTSIQCSQNEEPRFPIVINTWNFLEAGKEGKIIALLAITMQ